MQSTSAKPRYIVAVSGGVDSVVLLHLLYRYHSHDLVVAHVDHGIRKESPEDARFVRELAASYGLPYELKTLTLSSTASEDTARRHRYEFLRSLQDTYHGVIVTAHHADDVIETIAINVTRGTGWRGLAVFGAQDIYRPLTTWFKDEIIAYAKVHALDWHEDATNKSQRFLRNRIRAKTMSAGRMYKLELLALWRSQQHLRQHLETQARSLTTTDRYFYIAAPPEAAIEVLREYLTTQQVALTRPQLERLLLAIKVAKPGRQHHVSRQWSIKFTVRDFTLVTREK